MGQRTYMTPRQLGACDAWITVFIHYPEKKAYGEYVIAFTLADGIILNLGDESIPEYFYMGALKNGKEIYIQWHGRNPFPDLLVDSSYCE